MRVAKVFLIAVVAIGIGVVGVTAAHETEKKVGSPGFRPSSAGADAFVKAVGSAPIAVFPTVVRAIGGGTSYDRASQEEIVLLLKDNRLGGGKALERKLDAGKLEGNSQWEAFQAGMDALGKEVAKAEVQCDYALIVELLIPPYRSNEVAVWGIHCYVLDREGANAFSFLLNSHHKMFVDTTLRTQDRSAEGQEKLVAAAVRTAMKAFKRQVEEAAKQPYVERGEAHLTKGEFDQAIAAYSEAIRLDPTDSMTWLQTAPLLVLAGDMEGYRKHCGDMLHQFAKSEELAAAERTCKVCLLLPDTVEVSKLPLKTFEKALDDGLAPNWFCHWGYAVRALAAYRAGDAGRAVHWIRESQKSQGYAGDPTVQALALPVLTMAQHQLGQRADARQTLVQANGLIDAHLPKLATGELGASWHDWLIAQILHREAAELTAGRTKDPTPEAQATPK